MTSDIATRAARRREQFARTVGPHKQVSERWSVEVPAQHGIIAHRNWLAKTACGKDVDTTMVTRRDDRVRCPDCLATMPHRRCANCERETLVMMCGECGNSRCCRECAVCPDCVEGDQS